MPDEDIEKVFTDIFHNNKWRGRSKSGPGSSLAVTEPLREDLIKLFSDLGIRSLADAPCGTGEWITATTESLDTYMGFDVVKDVVEMARSLNNARPAHRFDTADITSDVLPRVDAILCRDCLVHLPFDLAIRAVSNFKASESTYLLATTFPQHTTNPPAPVGGWRPLNMERAPFNFPRPVRMLRDRLPREGDVYADKSVGVWLLAEINIKEKSKK